MPDHLALIVLEEFSKQPTDFRIGFVETIVGSNINVTVGIMMPVGIPYFLVVTGEGDPIVLVPGEADGTDAGLVKTK